MSTGNAVVTKRRDHHLKDITPDTQRAPVEFSAERASRRITSRELRRRRQAAARRAVRAGQPVSETPRRMVQRWSTEHYIEVVRDAHALGLGEVTTPQEYLQAMRAGYHLRAERRAQRREEARRVAA